MIFSTGRCYTMREIAPDLYEYVHGDCAALSDVEDYVVGRGRAR